MLIGLPTFVIGRGGGLRVSGQAAKHGNCPSLPSVAASSCVLLRTASARIAVYLMTARPVAEVVLSATATKYIASGRRNQGRFSRRVPPAAIQARPDQVRKAPFTRRGLCAARRRCSRYRAIFSARPDLADFSAASITAMVSAASSALQTSSAPLRRWAEMFL